MTKPAGDSLTAERMRAYRKRLKAGLRCASVQLRREEVAALIARGFLHPGERYNSIGLGDALGRLLDVLPPPSRWPVAPK